MDDPVIAVEQPQLGAYCQHRGIVGKLARHTDMKPEAVIDRLIGDPCFNVAASALIMRPRRAASDCSFPDRDVVADARPGEGRATVAR